jgi:hypothetical protein
MKKHIFACPLQSQSPVETNHLSSVLGFKKGIRAWMVMIRRV